MLPTLRICAAITALAVMPSIVHAESKRVHVTIRPLPEKSLTVQNTTQAIKAIQQTPGAVSVVPDTQFKNTNAVNIKDVVDWVPGVWAQPKWGDDSRLSIRGSSLSRNFHLRGVQLYMDGIPINTADGYGDFQEIDPIAYRYIEVFKGANALRFGANSLGGAINFVTPSGKNADKFDSRIDAGSFGYTRAAISTGDSMGKADYFVSGSAQKADGYRQHSDGHSKRLSANVGYRFSPVFETRFYVNANNVRQRIPGEVTRASALATPENGAANSINNDHKRNIDTLRIANKSTLQLDNTTLDFCIFGVDRHLMHPIFQWLDYKYKDYGAFARSVTETDKNRFTAGVNILNGTIDARQYTNTGGYKGALQSKRKQKPQNYTAYLENSYHVTPSVALVAGTQYLYAVREQDVAYTLSGDPTGQAEYSLWSPKAGLIWDVTPDAQVFGNISRSGEAPSFGESAAGIPFTDIKAQRATTYEIGTRGQTPDYNWDVSAYRANISNELQCLFSAFGNCNVTNADKTVHQGIEAGFGAALLKREAQEDAVWLNVAYTYSDFHFDGDKTFGNNKLAGAPEHYMRAEVLYKHPSGFSAGPNIEWVPEAYYVDSANTVKTEAYALLNAKATYEDDDSGFSGYIEGRNLTDKAYISSASIINQATNTSALFNPGTGRAIYAGMRYKF